MARMASFDDPWMMIGCALSHEGTTRACACNMFDHCAEGRTRMWLSFPSDQYLGYQPVRDLTEHVFAQIHRGIDLDGAFARNDPR